jgi:hypothetical protein
MLIAKILEVTACELNGESEPYTFSVMEFENGLIIVPSDTTQDWFFKDRESIEANGNDVVTGVIDTGEVSEWTPESLAISVKGSISEFGEGSVPAKYAELCQI